MAVPWGAGWVLGAVSEALDMISGQGGVVLKSMPFCVRERVPYLAFSTTHGSVSERGIEV